MVIPLSDAEMGHCLKPLMRPVMSRSTLFAFRVSGFRVRDGASPGALDEAGDV